MEKYFSLGMSAMAGILLIEGHYTVSILIFITAIYGMKGLIFE